MTMLLDLRDGGLREVPDQVRQPGHTSVNLSGNNLEHINSGSINEAVIEMDLSSNKLSAVPSSFNALVALTNLQLASNVLTSIGSSLSGLTNLKQLVLARNKLDDVSDAFDYLTALEYLDLSQNQLRGQPVFNQPLKQLTNLNLSDNRMTYLHKSIALCPKLIHLKVCCHSLSVHVASVFGRGAVALLRRFPTIGCELTQARCAFAQIFNSWTSPVTPW